MDVVRQVSIKCYDHLQSVPTEWYVHCNLPIFASWLGVKDRFYVSLLPNATGVTDSALLPGVVKLSLVKLTFLDGFGASHIA